MSMLKRSEGEMKSGKTMAIIMDALTKFHVPFGFPVWTNMAKVKFAQQIEIDDLLIFRKDIYNGVVLLDEAHTFLDPRQTRSAISAFMTYWLTQAGKRKLVVYYSSHLSGMVMPAARNLTGTVIKCHTPRPGGAVWFDAYNQQKLARAIAYKQEPPRDKRSYLSARGVHELWKVYDPAEVIDPFAYYRSQFNNSQAAKKILAAQDGAETAIKPANGLMRGRKSAATIQDERMTTMERMLGRLVDQQERIAAGQYMPYDPPPHGPMLNGIAEDD